MIEITTYAAAALTDLPLRSRARDLYQQIRASAEAESVALELDAIR